MAIVIDEVESIESSDVGEARMVECNWCGQIIPTGHQDLAAMCQVCYARMLADFQKAQRELSACPNASDR